MKIDYQKLLDRIKEEDKNIRAFLSLRKDLATENRAGALADIPIAIKANINIKGENCSTGAKILANYIAPYDATVIKKLKASGAVIVGLTNMDEFAMGSSTENSAFGATKNPRDLTRVPGGSSGGSAAAVAAGFVPVALGSDTGGSVRQPAGLCGIVGFKPTYGEVSRYGLIAMASSLDQIGVLATNVGDIKKVFSVIRGEDERDATSQTQNAKPKTQNHNSKLKTDKVKIGIPKGFVEQGLDDGVKAAWEKTIKNLGHIYEIVPVDLPHLKYSLAVYYIIMPVEVASNLARYDGVRFGGRRDCFGAEAKRRIILGTYVSSAGYADKYYHQAQKVRALIKRDFDRAFNPPAGGGIDFMMMPTSPTVAWKLGEKIDDPLKMYLSDIFTVPVNLAGLPAVSLPAATDGLPVGIQFIANQFEDDKLLDFCQKIEGRMASVKGLSDFQIDPNFKKDWEKSLKNKLKKMEAEEILSKLV